MKKALAALMCVLWLPLMAQQLPYFTQFSSHSFILNPACAGTKRLFDARISYRNQWVGFEDAPTTQGIAVNSALAKGWLGVGGIVYMDETGPTKRANYTGAAAFLIKMPDMRFCLGLSFSMIKYTIDGSKITLRSTRDAAIDQAVTDFDWASNASGGFYMYNDRFHFGLSAINLLESEEKFYEGEKEGIVTLAPHFYMNVGYNYAAVPKFVWRNSLQGKVSRNSPIVIDYKLNMFYDEKFFVGFSIRPKDAIALETGVVIQEDFQICYSYDIIVSKLKAFNSGTHEVMLVYSTSFGRDKGKGRFKEFQRQKYGYMF